MPAWQQRICEHLRRIIHETDPDIEETINQGHGNATARAMQIYEGDVIPRPALTRLFRRIVANNRAGGWR